MKPYFHILKHELASKCLNCGHDITRMKWIYFVDERPVELIELLGFVG